MNKGYRRADSRIAAIIVGALCLSSCGGGGAGGGGSGATPTPAPVTRDGSGCVVGTWKVAGGVPAATPYESEHFAFHWSGGITDVATVTKTAQILEAGFKFYAETMGLPQPGCESADKQKINVNITDTTSNVDFGGTRDGVGFIDAEVVSLGAETLMLHELVHVFQSQAANWRYLSVAFRETHANWMVAQVPGIRESYVGCTDQQVNTPHLYYGNSRNRYCAWQFLEHVKDTIGAKAVNDVLTKGFPPLSGDTDEFSILMAQQGWMPSRMNDEMAGWAMRNVGWDYVDPDGFNRGDVFRKSYGDYVPDFPDASKALRLTTLEPVDLAMRRFSVPAVWAPQRWGYNLVRLVPDAGSNAITIDFRGVIQPVSAATGLPGGANEPATVPAPDPGWRWSIVVLDAAGKPRYGGIMRGGDERLTVALNPDDKAAYLVVLGAPTQFRHLNDNQPYYSVYRYPWMVQVAGAMPWGYQAGAPDRMRGGRRHPNGGGWVSAFASVDPGAYVGPFARVFNGQVGAGARIEDHAALFSGTVTGNARVGGLTMLAGDVVLTDRARLASAFAPIGQVVRFTLSGSAQLLGDVQVQGDLAQYTAPPFTGFSRGVHYGMVLQRDENDPATGANRTDPVPEVTAVPNYVWR